MLLDFLSISWNLWYRMSDPISPQFFSPGPSFPNTGSLKWCFQSAKKRSSNLQKLCVCPVISSNSTAVKLQFKAGCWVKSQFKLLYLASDNKTLEWKRGFRTRHLSFVCWIQSTGRLFGWVCLATRHHHFHLSTVLFPHMGKNVQEYQDWCCMLFFF